LQLQAEEKNFPQLFGPKDLLFFLALTTYYRQLDAKIEAFYKLKMMMGFDAEIYRI